MARFFNPARVLAVALSVVGALLLFMNRVAPDESWVVGAVLVVLGAWGAVRPNARASRAALEFAAVTVLLFAGGEWMVRRENHRAADAYAERTMHFVRDPVLRYEFQPGLRGHGCVTNARGRLDADRALAKPLGTLRVACLGDSVGGDCSLPVDNACAALERELRVARGGRPVEVLNFSVPGYNTLQEARALELKAMAFEPDAVVVLFVLNDPYPDLAISHFLPGQLKFEHLLWSGARLAMSKAMGSTVDPFGGVLLGLYEEPRAWDGVVVTGFDRIRHTVAARRLPVAVAVFPLFLERPNPAYPPVYEQVVREAERHGFVGVNLATAAFASERPAALLKPSRDMIHPNARAHGLAAAAVARALVERHPELLR